MPTLTAVISGRTALLVSALVIVCAGCDGSKPDPSPARRSPSATTAPAVGAVGAPPRRGAPIDLSSLTGRVAFSRNEDIWIARADGSHARRVTRTRGPQDDPTWSPDGRALAYRDARRGYNHNDEIYAIRADGSHARNLTRTPSNEWSPAWSPSGKLIAFYAGELYVMRARGGRVRRVTRVEGEYPAWAPDSRRLAFMGLQPDARGANPDYDVFTVNVDGTGLKQLTDWPGEDGWPSWSPDGKWIAFTTTHAATGDDPGRSIYLMRPDGSRKHRLAVPLSASFPVWSPDGRTIMFTGTRPSEQKERLWVMRRNGSGRRPTPMDGGIAAWVAPDGRGAQSGR